MIIRDITPVPGSTKSEPRKGPGYKDKGIKLQQPVAPVPLLTPAVVRRLLRRSQVQVAAAAGVSISTIRIFELDTRAVRDREKRRALNRVYAQMRDEILAPPR